MAIDHKIKILLVDDEAIIAMSESRMLEKHGYGVLAVYSGEAAVQKAAERPDIDLVLMDIDLGSGMDGTEAAEIILKTRDIPVVFLSSHTEPEVVDKTEKITSYGYVVKNSGETVILASIKMAFKLHAAHRELRKREEELGKSQWKQNFIFDNTPNAITVTEMETGIVVEANKGIEWTGWTKEDVLGKSPQILQAWVHPDEGERIRNIIKSKGKLTDHRIDFYKKDGSIAHVLLNSVFLQMDGKQYLLTVSNDITRLTEYERELQSAKTDLEAMNEELNATVEELEATNEELMATIAEVEETRKDHEEALAEGKKTEEALRFKNLLLSTQQETSLDGILVVGKSGDILSYNSRFADMWGIPADILTTGSDRAALDHILGKLVNPEQCLEKVSHLYAHNTETSRDEMIFKDGRVFERYSSPMVDTHGAYRGRVWYFRDITDQKRAENDFRESEDRWRFALEGAGDGLWDWNARTDRVYFSHQWKAMVGYDDDEIGDALSEWDSRIHPDDRDRVHAELNKHLEGVIPIYMCEHRMKCKNGEYKWILDRGKVISRTPEGKPLRVIGTHTDITILKAIQEALGKAVGEKEALLRELQHRMKNSLTLINSIINLEIDRLKDNEMAGVLDNIKGRLESLASLYELLFQSDTFKEVDLGDYLKSIVRLLSGSYGAAPSDLRIEEDIEPMRVNAKSAAAWGLIANELLTNSFKYAFPKGGTGTIRINLKKLKNEIFLTVADDGAGMPPDFDINNPRGLGLLLVKTLSLQLKGSLTYERGKGTMFQVRVSISSEA